MAAESSASGGMRKAPSMEWRWVSTEEDEGEDRGGGAAAVRAVGRGESFESEEDDDDEGEEEEEDDEEEEGAKQKLIRTVPSVNWFDVEGYEVSVAQQLEDNEVRARLRLIALVFGCVSLGARDLENDVSDLRCA
ncbi:hypothetical protein GUJ93_ZPchr0004g39989 [Zizania palustris]|uniref:Uncharacterized protein n=1 Tax=Zizania palustris TaxID=103762 RepID=A0A8J5SSJ9_ZIZPA|nr:hypothetical protein GUJ93_ZPchr0004g39989 [Zizania palustris]